MSSASARSAAEIGAVAAAGEAIADRIVLLGRMLQQRGVDVALAEMIDAGRAATAIGVDSRDLLREALRSVLIKQVRDNAAFENAFDRVFPARPVVASAAQGPRLSGDGAAETIASDAPLGALATELVADHAGLDGELRSEGHHLQRAYRAADLARLMTEARKLDPSATPEDIRLRIEELKRLMAAEVRAHLGDDGGEVELAAIDDVDFLRASRAELDDMRDAIRPLARQIAARLARRRQKARSGRVNMRRTARRSIATGGVPFDLALERRRVDKPELFVLCDISGSVAEFSVFTLTLMAALSAELSETRSFVFADAVDEVTGLLGATGHGIEPWQLLRNTNVVRDDGHSDYGAVLEQFWTDVGERDLRPTSTVIIAGDGRSNYRASGADTLARIARRARRVYWLNPEPRAEWETHDSEMEELGACCSEVFEVRTLLQLRRAVEQIL